MMLPVATFWLSVVLLLGGRAAAAGVTIRDMQARVGIEQKLGQPLPLAVLLRDEQGNARTLGALLHGKPAVIALVYFNCPNLCTLTLNSLATSLKSTSLVGARDYEVLAVSIDAREGPSLAAAKRTAYLARYRIRDEGGCAKCDSGWHFLTGDSESLHAVSEALGYRYYWDAALGQYAHAAGIVIVTPQGRIAQYFNGIEFPPIALQRALQNAAANRTGSLAERLWLLCFHYDAFTGRYSAAVGVALRLLAGATLAALGVLLLRLKRAPP